MESDMLSLIAWWVRYFLHCVRPLYPGMSFGEETKIIEALAHCAEQPKDMNAFVRSLVPRFDNMRHRRKVTIRRMLSEAREYREDNADIYYSIPAEDREWLLRLVRRGFMRPTPTSYWVILEPDQCEACLEYHGRGHCHIEIVEDDQSES